MYGIVIKRTIPLSFISVFFNLYKSPSVMQWVEWAPLVHESVYRLQKSNSLQSKILLLKWSRLLWSLKQHDFKHGLCDYFKVCRLRRKHSFPYWNQSTVIESKMADRPFPAVLLYLVLGTRIGFNRLCNTASVRLGGNAIIAYACCLLLYSHSPFSIQVLPLSLLELVCLDRFRVLLLIFLNE